jgi:hypothetical protein
MTATEEAETEAPVGEQPAATEEPKVEENPVKGKKPRTPREKKPRRFREEIGCELRREETIWGRERV